MDGAPPEKASASPSPFTSRKADLSAATERQIRALGAALVTALAIVIALEFARVPIATYGARPSFVLEILLSAIADVYVYLWAPLLLCVGLMASAWLSARVEAMGRLRLPTEILLNLVTAGAAYWVLARYKPFADYHPLKALYVGLLVYGVGACVVARRTFGALSPRLQGLLPWGVVTSALGGAALTLGVNHWSFRGAYPTLHLSLLITALTLLLLGLWHLYVQLDARVGLRKGALRVVFAVAGALAVIAPAAAWSGALESARPYYTAFSTLGQSRVIFASFSPESETSSAQVPDDPEAVARFAERSGLPVLPEDFDLTRYNVLLLTSEATRFDETSLADPELATTPSLERLRDRDAFAFSRAYSPSAGTLQSMSSVLNMANTSSVALEIWQQTWLGELDEELVPVPKLFAAAGYRTFWIGHNHRQHFGRDMNGLGRGFDEVSLVNSYFRKQPTADKTIADKAIARLRRAAAKRERFFGWVFLVSPHFGYVPHYDDMPKKTPRQIYRQELRYADEQIGRVLDTLQETGLLDTTIVIYFGDHGEEFGEHGGNKHGLTVYSESTWVPMLIRIPGISGRAMESPTSTYYVFPWLLQRGSDAMRAAATEVLERTIGPMMRDTDGAVVIELLGNKVMKASLVYERYKFNYDFISGLHEAFDVVQDPLEQRDLMLSAPEVADQGITRFNAYRDVRASRRAFSLRPDKLSWRDERKRKEKEEKEKEKEEKREKKD